jgi:RNA polymerase sigma-70 factor (ECF subfamily)
VAITIQNAGPWDVERPASLPRGQRVEWATVTDIPSLVARAQAGDAAALEQLAREELPKVERLLGRLLGPRKDLEDLVQIVFVELMRSLQRFRGDSQFSTFVGGITVQVARRAMRRSAWDRRKMPMPDVEPPALDASVETVVHQRAQLVALRSALEALSEDHRVALLLWALEGLEPAAIAELTGASVSATRSRIWWAQKHLKRHAATDPLLAELVEES